MSNLLPCPFCGGEAELDTRQPYRNISTGTVEDACAAYCCSCSAQHTLCYRDHSEVPREHVQYDVIEAWNRRDPEPLAALKLARRFVGLPAKLADALDAVLSWAEENHGVEFPTYDELVREARGGAALPAKLHAPDGETSSPHPETPADPMTQPDAKADDGGEMKRAQREPRAKGSGWTLESSIHEGFSTEIWADAREPGQRTVAIVRDYADAVRILAAVDEASPLGAELGSISSRSLPIVASNGHPEAEPSAAGGSDPRRVNHCHADRDGDCHHADCPQLRDKEPATSGRHCPLDVGCPRCCLPEAECEC